MTIKELQSTVDQWIRDFGVRYFSELTNTAILMEEVGEVARVMARMYGKQSYKEAVNRKDQSDLAEELADVIFVIVCLANQTEIDLTTAIEKNLKKKHTRDHLRHKNNPKLK
ncbi:MAG: nucleotide pyrophosphohydrolase [Saprospiraceae bacterium]|nr:nucleotide pyrophosphohydrolase [Saprospiraceae bacterium]